MNNFHFTRLKAFAIFIFTCLIGLAQPPMVGDKPSLKIIGKVVDDKTNQPMQYVSVALYSVKDSSLAGGNISAADGSFQFDRLKPGEYYLQANFIGFDKIEITGIIVSPQNPVVKLPVIKNMEKAVSISEVEVVAQGPSLVYKVDKKVLTVDKQIAAKGGTAVEVLQNVPSVDSDLEGNVTVRGSSNFTVLIDGRQSPLSGSDALNQMSASAIDKIEIITNPSAKYDPDGTSGIINIITKKGKYNGVSFVANASVGTGRNTFDNDDWNNFTYAGDIALTVNRNKFNYTLTMGTRNEGSNMERTNDRIIYRDAIRDSSDYVFSTGNGAFIRNSKNLNAQVSYLLSENNTLYVGAGIFDFRLLRENFSKNKEAFSYNNETVFQTADNGFNVNPKSYQLVIGNKHEFGNTDHFLETELMYRFGDKINTEFSNQFETGNEWGNPSILIDRDARTNEKRIEYRAEIDYTRPLGNMHKLESGLILRNEFKETTYNLDVQNVPVTELSSFDYNYDYYRYIYGGYAIISGGNSNGISYSAGLRAEYTDRNLDENQQDTSYGYTKLDWYPSAAFSYDIPNGNKVQLTYSRRVERPRDYALFPIVLMTDGYNSFSGNPNLLPEYTDALELNYQFVWGQSYLAVESFFRNTTNAFDRVRQPADDGTLIGTWTNVGNEKYYGMEVSGNFIVAKWWTFSPSVSFYYSTVEGEYGNRNVYRYGYTGRGMVNNMFFITTKTQVQWNTSFRAPSIDLEGERKGYYYTSMAVKQDLLDRKLSLTFSVSDVLNSAKRETITDEPGFYLESRRQRQAPVYTFTASYRFNQTQRGRPERGEGNGDNGMDMMF